MRKSGACGLTLLAFFLLINFCATDALALPAQGDDHHAESAFAHHHGPDQGDHHSSPDSEKQDEDEFCCSSVKSPSVKISEEPVFHVLKIDRFFTFPATQIESQSYKDTRHNIYWDTGPPPINFPLQEAFLFAFPSHAPPVV